MRLEYMLLADAANLSTEGKLNVLGAFERIVARSFPVMHPTMTVVIRMVATPAERGRKKQIGIRLLNQDGVELATLESNR